jgi:hypothetical protein
MSTRPPAATPPARPAKPVLRWLGRVQWLLIPLLVFVALERKARQWVAQNHWNASFWSRKEQSQRADPPVKYFFLGSSRVAAAVDEKAFEAELGRQLGQPVQALNLGAGYSCLAQDYLYLRNRLRQHPNDVRGGVVFLEAFGGMPEPGEWGGRWFQDGWPELLTPLLRNRDLRGLWLTQMTLEEKMRLSADVLTHNCALLAYRERIGRSLMSAGEDRVVGWATPFFPPPPARGPSAVADLTTAGGIRNDADGVEAAKALAVSLARQDLAHQVPVRDWEKRIVADLVRLVRKGGGQVAFFEMPLHPVQASMYQTDIRRADRAAFREQARRWGTPFLEPDFVSGDEDFPDYWHLRQSRSAEFGVRLARALLADAGEQTASAGRP